jgi:hypothetical protein
MSSGMAAALVLVPAGMAQAGPEDSGNPLGEGAAALDGVVKDVPVVSDLIPGADDGEDTDDVDPGTEPPVEAPEFAVPPEVLAAFQQLAAQAGISEDCVTGIADGIALIGNGLAGLPAELEALVTDLGGAIQEAIESQDPAAIPGLIQDLLNPAGEDGESPVPIGGGVVAGLQLIATTLAEDCAPTPPTAEEPEPEPEVDDSEVVHPAPEHPAPPAAQPVAQPVSYPGYAPTGVDTARADDVSVPLTALGGGLVLVAAGAAGYGMRGRAVRTRD